MVYRSDQRMARSHGKKGSGIVWRVVVQGETGGNAGARRDGSAVGLAAAHFLGYGALSA